MERVTLSEYNNLAYNAFHWTSFNPDRAGERTIREHEDQLNNDLENIPESEYERYIANYKKLFSSWLSTHCGCASSAVTGGSGFNVRRAEKANTAERNKYAAFMEWREKALKAIAKRKEESKPEDQKRNEVWQRLENKIRESAATIEGIDKHELPYSKPLFVSSIYVAVETFAKHGDVDMVERAIGLVRSLNEQHQVITERHKLFKLPEVALANKETKIEESEKESTEVPFKGGKAVSNYKEDRIQLIFDEKPSPEIISALKKIAFKWSPRFGAWQRQLTGNAMFATKKFLKDNELI